MKHPESIFGRVVFIACLAIIILLGFYMRTISIKETIVPVPFVRDATDYYMYAYNLYHHGIYSSDLKGLKLEGGTPTPDATRSPGYPFFLYFFMWLRQHQTIVWHVMFVQSIISGLTIVIVYFIFKKFLTKWWALLAVFLTAISPHMIAINSFLLSETLFSFVLSSACLSFLVYIEKPKWLLLLFSGFIFGTANLIRAGLIFFPIFMPFFFFSCFRKQQWKKKTIVFMTAFYLTLTPWMLRNMVTFGKISDERLEINFLHHGIYPDFMFQNKAHTYTMPYRYDPESPEISKSKKAVLEELFKRFRLEPGKYIWWYIVKKPISFWSWGVVQGFKNIFIYPVSSTPYWTNQFFMYSHRVMRFFHGPIVILGLIGCLFPWMKVTRTYLDSKKAAALRFLALLLIYYTLLHIAGAPFPRYSIPLRPFLYGLAVFSTHFMVRYLLTIWNDKDK